jgi:hypothetical protein
MSGCEPLKIGRTAPGEMRARDAEMVEKLGQAVLDRAVRFGFSGGCYCRFPLVFASMAPRAGTGSAAAATLVRKLDFDLPYLQGACLARLSRRAG